MNPIARFLVGIVKRTQYPKFISLIMNRLFWFEFYATILDHYQKSLYITCEGVDKLAAELTNRTHDFITFILQRSKEAGDDNPLVPKLAKVFGKYWK